MNAFVRSTMVPELLVTDLSRSLAFWVDLCGFEVVYRRDEEGFVFLDLDGAQFMLDELGKGDYWVTGPLQHPSGRGVNFEIDVKSIKPVLRRLQDANWPLFRALQERWYRRDSIELGVHQFLVQDPDGYLLRFSAVIGERPAV